MISAQIEVNNHKYSFDLSKSYDLSIPMVSDALGPRAWYVDPLTIRAVENEYFIGDVNRGGSVNFRNIFFNPHGHGTHTECLGHISKEQHSINGHYQDYSLAILISVTPEQKGDDLLITLDQIQSQWPSAPVESLVLRTLPNREAKKSMNWSDTNPPYLEREVATWLREQSICNLLIDLPSVDREEDGGELAAHHAFWNYPEKPRTEATITEFIFVDDNIQDGLYLLQLQVAPFENDASPSRPTLYPLLAE